VGVVPYEVHQRELERRRAYSNTQLLRALGEGDGDERSYAFLALVDAVPQSGAFAHRRAWSPGELRQARRELLRAAFDRGRDPLGRAQALYALSRLGLHDPELVQAVQLAFADPHAEVRVEAVRAFPEDRELAARQLGAYLIAALDDPARDVRWSAVHRLGDLPEVGQRVAGRLFALLEAEDDLALAAAFTLKNLVDHGAMPRDEAAARVEAAPLTPRGVLLVVSLLAVASDEFVVRAARGAPAIARVPLQKLAESSPERLGVALDALRRHNPSGFVALIDEALIEEDDYLALARGYEEVWAEALRPQLGPAEPELRDKIAQLLDRWAAL
jgi:hypothetical protein